MAETIDVRVIATDGSSKVFQAIGKNATDAGNKIEAAGKDGAAGLKQIDTAAKATGRSLQDLETRGRNVGAAIGTLVTATSLLGANYRDQQREISGINALYGEQADEVLAVTERIQDMTRFSNDAARESFLLASSLVGNYDLSTAQLDILLSRSADLAQVYGFTLPDAVQRTSSALRGEGESAERLGLNMSDAAIAARALDAGITNWNVPGALSEAEKAAFRFQVFMEQTEGVVGEAAAAAEGAGGGFRQLINTFDDAGEAAGKFLGPVGQVAAEMAPLAIAAPIVGAGIGKMGAMFASTAVGARAASLAVGSLGLVVSPLGLALAGVALAGVGVYKIFQNIEASASGVAEGVGLLADEVERLKLAAQPEAAAQVQEIIDSIEAQIELLSGSDMAEITKNLGLPEGTDFLQITSPGGLADQVKTAGQLTDDLASHIIATLGTLPPAAQQVYLDWINGLLSTVEHTAEGSNLDDIIKQVLLTPASEVPGVLAEIEAAAGGAAGGLDQFAGSVNAAGMAMYGQVTAQVSANREFAAYLDTLGLVQDATQEFLGNGDNILDFWLEYQTNLREATEATIAANEELDKGSYLSGPSDYVTPLEAAFEATVRIAEGAYDAGVALDSILNTFSQIDALGQRSSQAGSIADTLIGSVEDNLAGAEAAMGTLESLWERVRAGTAETYLTQTQYNEALNAAGSIQQSNLRVQDDLTAMRAQQLPLLAQEQAAYEAQIDAISQLPALEQRRALALQDSAVQAQLATQYATAYQASIGEIPEEVATQMIVSAAEADPVIADLLTQMGLIEEGADGTITVNFPDGPTVQESISQLTASIDALTIAMGGVPPLRVEADTAEAEESVMDIVNRIGGLDGKTTVLPFAAVDNVSPVANQVQAAANALTGKTIILSASDLISGAAGAAQRAVDSLRGKTVELTARNLVSGAVAAAQAAIDSLRGRSVTNTVTTNYQTTGERPSAVGGIPELATGGITARLGELGPELLRFAGGGTAWAPSDGIYNIPPMTYVQPAHANTTTYGSSDTYVFNIAAGDHHAEMRAFVTNEFLPAIERRVRQRNTALGVA